MKRDERPRELLHFGDVDGRLLEAIYHRPRLLVLCTYGGDMEIALACVDALERYRDITVLVTGACMSAGLPVLAAASRRIATPRTRFMSHPICAEVRDGSRQTLRVETGETDRLEREHAQILADRTQQPVGFWEALGDKLSYFGVKEALEWGLIDSVLGVPRQRRGRRPPRSSGCEPGA